ncbi:hypothetical protein SNE40_001572 [Patella caerulea]|uniref:Uncharacterized protein n=1 Tax=Patella caerulea TaxID=87958 RepID=A0AAN8KJ05_PATCE
MVIDKLLCFGLILTLTDRCHASNNGRGDLDSLIDTEPAFNYLLSLLSKEHPRDIPDFSSRLSKRRMTWRPLGYLPAHIRITEPNAEEPDEGSSAGSPVFRYG